MRRAHRADVESVARHFRTVTRFQALNAAVVRQLLPRWGRRTWTVEWTASSCRRGLQSSDIRIKGKSAIHIASGRVRGTSVAATSWGWEGTFWARATSCPAVGRARAGPGCGERVVSPGVHRGQQQRTRGPDRYIGSVAVGIEWRTGVRWRGEALTAIDRSRHAEEGFEPGSQRTKARPALPGDTYSIDPTKILGSSPS